MQVRLVDFDIQCCELFSKQGCWVEDVVSFGFKPCSEA